MINSQNFKPSTYHFSFDDKDLSSLPTEVEAPNSFGEYSEKFNLGITENARSRFLEKEWASYRTRRDHQIKPPHLMGEDAQRLKNWEDLVFSLNRLGNSPGERLLKARIVNSWVNTYIAYDYAKQKIVATDHNIDWIQTPYDTLRKGSGVCSDEATLKYETLRRVGLDSENMRLVNGRVFDSKGAYNSNHMVLEINVAGHNIVLSNQNNSSAATNGQERFAKNFKVNSGANAKTFVPEASYNESGMKSYNYNSNGSWLIGITTHYITAQAKEWGLPSPSSAVPISGDDLLLQYNHAVAKLGLIKINRLISEPPNGSDFFGNSVSIPLNPVQNFGSSKGFGRHHLLKAQDIKLGPPPPPPPPPPPSLSDVKAASVVGKSKIPPQKKLTSAPF